MINSTVVCSEVGEDKMAPYKLFNFVLIMSISLVGILGNLLVILTFSRQKRRTSATTFLKNLATFDIFLIISTNLFAHRYAYTLVFPKSWVDHMTAGKLTIGVLPISYICQSFSTWTVVAVALDRYIHVCHPLKAMKWCRIKIANKVVLGIVIISVVYNIPRFFEYYKILQVAKEAIDPCTGYFLTPANSLGANEIYKYSYAFGMYMTVMYALPLGSLLFFNGKLIKKLNSLSVPGEKQKVTKLKGSDKILPSLVGVVTIFLVCQIPDMILQILWRVNSPFAPTFSIIAYDFVIINASINFVVYVVAADGFRRSLRVYVLPCLKSGSNSEELSHTGPSIKRAKSSLSNSTDNHHGGGRNWGQSYSNPEPIDETDECSSSEEEIAEEATAQKEKSTTRIWLGGTRKPGKDEVESHIACEPTTVVLPSGVNLGSAGVYTIISDPLLQQSPGKYTHHETRAYITCKTDV